MMRIAVWGQDLNEGYLRTVTQLGVHAIDMGSGQAFQHNSSKSSRTVSPIGMDGAIHTRERGLELLVRDNLQSRDFCPPPHC